MTDPTYTDLTMVLDRSGSMQSIKDDTIGGFDALSPSSAAFPVGARSAWCSSTGARLAALPEDQAAE